MSNVSGQWSVVSMNYDNELLVIMILFEWMSTAKYFMGVYSGLIAFASKLTTIRTCQP
jgi:hypothetical protein